MSTLHCFLVVPLLLGLLLFEVTAQPVRIVPQSGHRFKITDMVCTPDGKNLITCSSDQTLIWDLKTGFHYQPLKTGGLFCLAISPDGKYLAGFTERTNNGTDIGAKLVVAKLPAGEIQWEVPFKYVSDRGVRRMYGLTFSADSQQLLSVTYNEYQLWDISSRKKIAGAPLQFTFDSQYDKNFLNNIVHPVLSPDNQQFVVINNDREIGLYQTSTGEQIRVLNKKEEENNAYFINALTFLNNHKLVAATSDNGRLKASWDTRSGKVETHKLRSQPYTILNKEVLLGIGFDSLTVFDLKTMRAKLKVPWKNKAFGGEHHLFALSPSSDLVAVYYENKNQLQIYSLISGSLIKSIDPFNPVQINDIAFTESGNLVFQTGVRNYGRYDQLWHFNLHALQGPIDLPGIHDSPTNHYLGSEEQVFGPTGQFLYYVDDYSYDKKLCVKALDKPHQKDEVVFNLPNQSFDQLKISPDGRWLEIQNVGLLDLKERKLHPEAKESIFLFSNPPSATTAALQIKQQKHFNPGPGLNDFFCICGKTMFSVAIPKGDLQIQEIAPGALQLDCPHRKREKRIVDARYFPDKHILFLNREEHIRRPNDLVVLDLQNWKTLAKVRHQSLKNGFFVNTNPPMIISHEPGKAFFWNPLSGRLLDSLTTISQQSNRLNTSKDHRLLAVSTFDGSIEFWDWKQKKKEATILTLEEDGYLVFTPDGYYATNKNSGRVCFQVNRELHPLEVFDVQYNRPDIILERLGFADPQTIEQHRKIVQKRLQKMGLSLASVDLKATRPEIEISSTIPQLETTARNFSLEVHASDEQTPLAYLQILINEVPIFGKSGYRLDQRKRREFQKEFNIELGEGKNIIQLFVINQKGVSSSWEMIETHYIGPKAASDLHLIAIGVSRYQDSRMNLNYARKDAEDVVKLFRSRPGSFQQIHTYEFYDKNVNRQSFLNLRTQLLKTKTQDRVIIFIAGHGLRDKNLDYYLATYDTDFSQPQTKGIAFDQIEALLDGIPARQKVIFMDACHSGELDKEEVEFVRTSTTKEGTVTFRSFGPTAIRQKAGQLNSFELMKEQFVDLRRNSGAVVISAAGGVEFAMESEKFNNGVFTFSLLKGMTELAPGKYQQYEAHLLADANADHRVTVSELRQYLFNKVPELTQGRQQPTTRVDYLYNDFILWEYNPGQSIGGKLWGSSDFDFTTAEELQQLLNSGLSVNEKDNNGATLLMYSLYKLNDVNWLRKLVNMGADPREKGRINYQGGSSGSYYGSPLAIAAAQGNLEAVKYLLENCKIPVDDKEYNSKSKTESGWTALQWAANNNHKDIVAHLIEKGATIDITMDDNGDTPLRLASQNGHKEIVELLLFKGADPKVESKKGWTALHFAARLGQTAVIPSLLKSGLAVDRQTSEGWTPLMLAAQNRYFEICRQLLEAGADCNPLSPEKKALSEFSEYSSYGKELSELIKTYCR